jgi:hypothetical protein
LKTGTFTCYQVNPEKFPQSTFGNGWYFSSFCFAARISNTATFPVDHRDKDHNNGIGKGATSLATRTQKKSRFGGLGLKAWFGCVCGWFSMQTIKVAKM